MFGMKLPERLDQPTYWMWVVPLVLGHLLLAAVLMSGAKGLGALDTVVIVWLAMVVAARFKDIGWPRWVAPAFMLGTMLLLPLVAIGVAIATSAAPSKLLSWMNNIGLIAAPANLLLVVIAGSVPGDHQADPPAASLLAAAEGPPIPELAQPVPASPPSVAVSQFQARDAWVVGGGATIIVLIVAAFFGGAFNTRRQQGSAPTYAAVPVPSPQARSNPPQMQLESNGLTKSTNDFLRQLSQSPTNRR